MPRILAIDDKPDNLISISALLTLLIPDCSVITALSGAEGLAKATADPPDVILLDIRMPGMDGFEVCQHLRAAESTSHIPVIMLTAIETESSDLVKGLEIGADAYLTKPINEYVLAAHVKTALRIKSAEDRLRRQKDMLEEMVQDKIKALRESEKKYRVLFESLADGVVECDLKGHIISCNQAYCTMTRHTEYEIKNMRYQDFTPEKWLEADNLQLNHALANVHSEVYEKELLRKDGSVLPVSVRIWSKRDDDGELLGFWRIIRDIRERKRVEEERNILQHQLQQAQKMESIGTLAGGIAHDFNNILSPIMIHAEMAIMELPDNSPLMQSMNQIYSGCERARDLVKQILTFARKQNASRAPLQLSVIVKEVVRFLRSAIPSTIAIEQRIYLSDATVLADPTQMNQVVINLCTNAAHAMREKGGVLEIALEKVVVRPKEAAMPSGIAPGNWLKLSVTDTGPGIAPDCVDKIFDPYFTTKAPGEGTGMGLALVHGIVTSHGGDIFVESEPGKGAAFHVWLPHVEREQSTNMGNPGRLPRGNERILFIDDEKAAVDAVQPMLRKLGYQVTAKTSSVEALETFREAPGMFDLVITDHTMPHLTGKLLSQEILAIRPEIPIVLCTGFTEQIDESQAKDMGICAFVMKPITMQQIAWTIREVLGD